jgi:SAM-dependent methyltransferase
LISVKEIVYMTLGRASELLDRLSRPFVQSSGRRSTDAPDETFDRTGLTVNSAQRLEILHRSDDLLYVKYDRPSHSFWRAQEFSLFWRHRHLIGAPLADFGCGDGSFASAIFDSVAYGIDHDPDALLIAGNFNLYKDLVQSRERSIPLPDSSVRSIMSNSVLEHVSDLPTVLDELYRILQPGGRVVFTVPLCKFRTDLAKYYGRKTSERINRESYHRNLLTESQWRDRLSRARLATDLVIHYQPDWFTFWYRFHRLSGPQALGKLIGNLDDRLWQRYRDTYLKAVRESIDGTSSGANIFVVAHKRK